MEFNYFFTNQHNILKTMTRIMITKLSHATDLSLPAYATPHSAGMDLLAAIEQDLVVHPRSIILIQTGIAIALPDGYEAQIRSRSGLAIKNGVTVINAPGTIDSDYRGEIKVGLINMGKEPFVITRGMRIAQMVIAQYTQCQWNEVTELPSSIRREGGFGSTGV